jgi:hypothetical protein
MDWPGIDGGELLRGDTITIAIMKPTQLDTLKLSRDANILSAAGTIDARSVHHQQQKHHQAPQHQQCLQLLATQLIVSDLIALVW